MAKNQYIGVNNVARKVKQPYIGVNNVARKVKSGYVGVGGVARQYYESVVYNTWKKWNNINGANFYLKDMTINSVVGSASYYDNTKISIDNGLAPPKFLGVNMSTGYSSTMIQDNYRFVGYNIKFKSNVLDTITASSIISTVGSGIYTRAYDNVNHGDQIIIYNGSSFTDLNTMRSVLFVYFIPGWKYANTALFYYDSYNRPCFDCLRFEPDDSICTMGIYNKEKDNDGDTTEDMKYYECNNYAGIVTAPQGTYPDFGIHSDGCIYIKQ